MPRTELALPGYRIVVIETNDLVTRRKPEMPCLYLGAHRLHSDGMETGISNVAGLPQWVTKPEAEPRRRLDLEVETVFQTQRRAKARVRRERIRLSNLGYTVNRDNRVYSLYVIEVRPQPDNHPPSEEVYVGHTAKPIADRYQEHLEGGRPAARIFKNGARRREPGRVRRDLARGLKYFTRDQAEQAETRLGIRLQERGFVVYGPQNMPPAP